MSLAILIPIGVLAVIAWHEWTQRKLPWPGERRREGWDD
jgi:hypothetical protein